MKTPTPLLAGPDIAAAQALLVLVHGRGAPASGMIELYDSLDVPHIAAVAPQAPNHTWYPQSFLAALDSNQPFLDQSLAQLHSVVSDAMAKGMPSQRIALLGFSQGACLCAEYSARHPRQFAAIMCLTGGLIGPPGTPRNYSGSLDGTPVFLGTSDPDPHVPFPRVQETRDVLIAMGAEVSLRRYPGMPHTINEDELDACRQLLLQIPAGRSQNP